MPGVSTQPRRPASGCAATTAPPRGGSRFAAAAARPSRAGSSGEAGSHPLPQAPPCLLFGAGSRAVTHCARAAPRPKVCPGREPLVVLRARRAGRAACGHNQEAPSRPPVGSVTQRGQGRPESQGPRSTAAQLPAGVRGGSCERRAPAPWQPGPPASRDRRSVVSGALRSRTRSAALLCFRRPIYIFLYYVFINKLLQL